MKYFDLIALNDKSFAVPGYFDVINRVVIVDCDELKVAFESWYRTGATFKLIEFYSNGKLINSFSGEYIVNSLHLNEAEFVRL